VFIFERSEEREFSELASHSLEDILVLVILVLLDADESLELDTYEVLRIATGSRQTERLEKLLYHPPHIVRFVFVISFHREPDPVEDVRGVVGIEVGNYHHDAFTACVVGDHILGGHNPKVVFAFGLDLQIRDFREIRNPRHKCLL
jgi:hypothetical protein